MITNGRLITKWFGISSDTKPKPPIRNGSVYYEMDTIRIYMFDEESEEWLIVSSGTDITSAIVGIGAVGYMKI